MRHRTIHSFSLLGAMIFIGSVNVACGPNPGELGYFNRIRVNHSLEGRLSQTPLATGSSATIEIYDETGSCIQVFPWNPCYEVNHPISFASSNPAVLDVVLVSNLSEDASTTRLDALAEGHAEFQILDADGALVDFLPIEVADATQFAITDVGLETGLAMALPPDIGIPTAFEIPLRVGLADRHGRMLQHQYALSPVIDVREGAAGFAIGPDTPNADLNRVGDDEGDDGDDDFDDDDFDDDDEPTDAVEPLEETTASGVVSSIQSEYIRLRANDAATMRVEAHVTYGDARPTSFVFHSRSSSTGTLSVEVRDAVKSGGQLKSAELCAQHRIEGVFQVGWTYEWELPAHYSAASVAHKFESGGTRRCVRVVENATDPDENESFVVRVDSMEAAVALPQIMAHAHD